MNFSITLLKTLQEAVYNCSKQKAVSFCFEKRDLNFLNTSSNSCRGCYSLDLVEKDKKVVFL